MGPEESFVAMWPCASELAQVEDGESGEGGPDGPDGPDQDLAQALAQQGSLPGVHYFRC